MNRPRSPGLINGPFHRQPAASILRRPQMQHQLPAGVADATSGPKPSGLIQGGLELLVAQFAVPDGALGQDPDRGHVGQGLARGPAPARVAGRVRGGTGCQWVVEQPGAPRSTGSQTISSTICSVSASRPARGSSVPARRRPLVPWW